MNKRSKTRPLNKTRKNVSRRSSAASAPSKRAWIIAILLLSLFIGGIAYFNHYRNNNPSSAIHRFLNRDAKSVNTVKAPVFEFYTALPSGKLAPMEESETSSTAENAPHKTVQTAAPSPSSVPKASATPNVTSPPAPVTIKHPLAPTTTSTEYFLQVAAFPHYEDADKLKAELLLDEFNANVSGFQSNNTKWYRVVVGPFHNLAALNQAQSQLNTLHYQAIRLQPTK